MVPVQSSTITKSKGNNRNAANLKTLWYLHKWTIGLLLLNLCPWESKNIPWATVSYPAHSIRPVF